MKKSPQEIEIAETVKLFQSEQNRLIEESFAQSFSENNDIKLFFINEDSAYTDGKNIIVDPCFFDIYKDDECVKQTLDWLQIKNNTDTWTNLKIVTRGLTIHESLHIIYSNLPCNAFFDPKIKSKNQQKTLADIENIIEDSYIENVGASVYDNIDFYLQFNNVAMRFATKEVKSTAEEKFKSELKGQNKAKIQQLILYLNYMTFFLLSPFYDESKQQNLPKQFSKIKKYIDKTKQLFLDGSIQESPDLRYEYSKKILEVIKDLIPNDDDLEIPNSLLPKTMYDTKTHGQNGSSFTKTQHKGKSQSVTTRLFKNLDGTKKDDTTNTSTKNQLILLLDQFASDKKECQINISDYDEIIVVHQGSKYNSKTPSVLHKNIKITELHPKVNLNLKKTYQNIYEHYKLNINSYNSKFYKLLKADVQNKESNYLFGTSIESKKLGDVKKRYWSRNVRTTDIPDLSILILIDGSGSMDGPRRDSAMKTCVILHEVLKKQGLTHAIIEHRAPFGKPEIKINILTDFNCKEEHKYNIMQLDANDNTRDGLALLWAEDYINQKTQNQNKLILVISDGEPCHDYDDYYPPISTKDTANIVKKIISRGTNIIAISLDEADDYSTFDNLQEIYPHLVGCNDLTKLTGQVLNVISKELN